jgi:hypothetical protein
MSGTLVGSQGRRQEVRWLPIPFHWHWSKVSIKRECEKDAIIGTLDCDQSVNHLGRESKTVINVEGSYGASSLATGLCLGPQLYMLC